VVGASEVFDAHTSHTNPPSDTNAPDDTNVLDANAHVSQQNLMDFQASQVVDSTHGDQPIETPDHFEDIPDYELLTVEDIIAADVKQCLEKRSEEQRLEIEQKKISQVKSKKVKDWKNKYASQGTNLSNGKQRKSSERIKAQFLSKPIVGIGSSVTQPIEIK
jgi:hypothetical protein